MTSHGRPPAHARTVPESAIARLAAREHAVWTRLGGGPVVRQCVRLLIALTLADGMARLAHLREPVWSLITAVIVTQGSITETMSTGRDQIIGTLIGAGAGIAVIALGLTVMPWQVAFLVALPPLVWLSAWRGARRFALITLMIIVLFPSEGGAFARPFDRLLSILCGVVASVVVSYLVLHRPARREAFATAAAMFGDIATMLGKALERRADQAELVAMTEAGITKLLRIDALLTEASREGRAALARRDPMLARLPGVLRRVQGDAFLVARAVNAGK
ncbi:FUSC family protein, partial [Ameyamaea chiangmaiensis]